MAAPRELNMRILAPAILIVLATIVTVSVWQIYVADMTVIGFGVEHYAYFATQPELFERDFPIGIQNYHISLPMTVYPFALTNWGIEPSTTALGVIVFQAIMASFGVYLVARALGAARELALIVVAVILVSALAGVNLSAFSSGLQSQINQLYYGFAQGFRLFALVFFLRDKPLPGALFLTLSVLSHPVIGALGVVFVGAYYLFAFAKLTQPRVLLAFGMTGIVSIAYLLWVFAGRAVVEEVMAAEDFIRAGRSFSSHWNPISRGFFTDHFYLIGGPVLWAMLLGWLGLQSWSLSDQRIQRLIAGSIAMLVLAVIGVIASDIYPIVFMIKLSPQRGTELITWFAVVIALIHMARCVSSDDRLMAIAATFALAALFVPEKVVFLPAILPLLLLQLYRGWFGPWQFGVNRSNTMGNLMLPVLILALFAAMVWIWPDILAPKRFEPWLFAAMLVPGLLIALMPKDRLKSSIASIVLILALLGYTAFHRADRAQAFLDRHGALAVDFKAAQEWARDHTEQGSLFLVDPSFVYGWRDYSRRPSFGNYREWALHGFSYETDGAIYREGLRRLALFDIDPVAFADEATANGELPRTVQWRTLKEIKNNFNTMDLAKIIHIAADENVDYVVLFKQSYQAKRDAFKPSFDNERVAIFKVSP